MASNPTVRQHLGPLHAYGRLRCSIYNNPSLPRTTFILRYRLPISPSRPQVLVEPAADPWVAAAPLAVASLPLTAALCSPSIANLELANVRLLLGGQPVIQMYEPSDGVGTRTLVCRTAIGEKVVATVRVTARLAHEPQVSEQLLAALQPALQVRGGGTSFAYHSKCT